MRILFFNIIGLESVFGILEEENEVTFNPYIETLVQIVEIVELRKNAMYR